MVLVPKAVVNEQAMMIKLLHAVITVVAVVSVFRSQVLTVDANVVHMKIALCHFAEQIDKVRGLWHIAWVFRSY